jgi:hypothetical protein
MIVYAKCVQNGLYYRSEHVLGYLKHPVPLLGATLHRRNGPGQSCKLVDNAHTSQTHSFDARVPHNIQNAQHSAYHRTHLSKSASNPPRIMGCLHRAGEQSHLKRKWQHHCRNTRTTKVQRAEAAQSMRHWLAKPPPCANHVSSISLPGPVEKRASWLIQLEICVPLQPRTEQTFKPPVI